MWAGLTGKETSVYNRERNREPIMGEFPSTVLGKQLWDCVHWEKSQTFWRDPMLCPPFEHSLHCPGLIKPFLDVQLVFKTTIFFKNIVFETHPQHEQESKLLRTSPSRHYFESFACYRKWPFFSGWEFLETEEVPVFSLREDEFFMKMNLLISNSEDLSP